MRLGGPLFEKHGTPEKWVELMKTAGYRAGYCPVGMGEFERADAYAEAAREAGIVISEVGAWSNPLSLDETTRKEAMERCVQGLALADRIGARCCVNIAGSHGNTWHGPCANDLTHDTFDRIVAIVREIIDAVRPTRSCYALETMPWLYPDDVDSYLRLIRAVDRKGFGVHFDPVNLISSPQRYFRTREIIRDFVAKLGPHIRSCHAKDIILHDKLTVHLDETRPGLGGLDYGTFLRELSKLDKDLPLMMEHLPTHEEYQLAAAHIRQVAVTEGAAL